MTGNKDQKGFTFVESLIVIAMIGILSVVIIPSYQSARSQLALERAAVKLAQDIRKVQEMALSAYECGSPCGGSMPLGYGIYIDKNDSLCPDDNCYHIYADIVPAWGKYSPGDPILETIYLESDVGIDDLTKNIINIVFIPPDPMTSLSGKDPTDPAFVNFSLLSITIGLDSDPTKQKSIKVNAAGLIDID
jgi:prepilin-type N-terminal cleavage/methylation domain-containing protein